MPTCEDLASKQSGIDAKLARGIEKITIGVGLKARMALSQALVSRMGGPS